MNRPLTWCLLFPLLACGGGSSGTTDDAGSDAGTPPAPADAGDPMPPVDAGYDAGPHEPFPQVPSHGGRVLAAPEIVSVSFGATDTDIIHAFADWAATSPWLSTVGADYGVGAGTHVQSVALSELPAAQVTDLEVQQLLINEIADGGLLGPTLADGGANLNRLYLVHYPPGTVVYSLQDGPDSCSLRSDGTLIGGYHFNVRIGANRIPYAVVPTCAVESAAELTVAASHELIEAATDPEPNNGFVVTSALSPWSLAGGEVADLCDNHWVDAGFTVSRVYSNTAALSGGSPCVPLANALPYYGVTASPALSPTVDAGSSVSFDIQGWSSGDVPEWIVGAYPQQGVLGVGGSFTPIAHLTVGSMQNGGTATLTVKVPAGTPPGSYGITWLFNYHSLATYYDDFSSWPVVVYAR